MKKYEADKVIIDGKVYDKKKPKPQAPSKKEIWKMNKDMQEILNER